MTSTSAARGRALRALPRLEDSNRFFWTSGEDGRLRFLQCTACRHYVHPPVPRCPYCLVGTVAAGPLVPEPVSGTGVLHSFTVNHQQWIPGSDPYVIGLVTVAEQDDVRLTQNLVACAPDHGRIGMAVEVTFEPAQDVWLPLF